MRLWIGLKQPGREVYWAVTGSAIGRDGFWYVDRYATKRAPQHAAY